MGAGLGNYVTEKFYLPGSPSAPPVSPSFSPYWTDVSSATRGLASLHFTSGNSFESLTVNGAADKKVLVRQYVLPLSGLALINNVGPARFGTLALTSLQANLQDGCRIYTQKVAGNNPTLATRFRFVNPDGTEIGPPLHNLSSVTIAAGNAVITSPGLFVPRDQYGLIQIAVEGSPIADRQISQIISSSSARVDGAWAVSDPQLGTHAAKVRWSETGEGDPIPIANFGTYQAYDTGVNYLDGGSPASTLNYIQLFSLRLWETSHLVIEIGFKTPLGAGAGESFRFGSPSATLITDTEINNQSDFGSGHSTGGSIGFSRLAGLIV